MAGKILRKQYHFRRVGPDLLIWDIHRLIRLAAPLEPEMVAVGAIAELDENWWYAETDALPTPRGLAAHMALALEADPAYPVLLSPDGRLLDGMHRLVRALVENRTEIAAIRFPTLPAPDYINRDPDSLPYPDEEI